ncbi:MAG: oxidoreductase [Acidimicrobiia bacterium]|nr:oxidoreductase [Acidimicrobiia bacterium]
MSFTALVLTESKAEEGKRPEVIAELRELDESELPEGDVLIAVEWSSLNYKDGMILNGLGRLVRQYPHVPGVDLAGVVLESSDDRYRVGERVAVTGWRVGEVHWGGYSQRARVRGDWLVHLPDQLSTRQAMAVGTAGFTAMQALLALEAHGLEASADNPLLVTGASGGVGSSAIQWGAARGHHIVASTGRMENADELMSLGAAEVIDRAELAENPTRPLLTERWAGCVDAVGGDTLAHVLAEMRYGASVAACGLAGGNSLPTTVIPFLLRGVNLLGIDSVQCPYPTRIRVWDEIAQALDAEKLDSMTSEVALADVASLASDILAGRVKGRTVVRCQD